MKNKLIDELEKTIEFLHQTGWHKQAVWYENKLKLIKESEEGCASFYQNLHEVDASLTGMGSFSRSTSETRVCRSTMGFGRKNPSINFRKHW